MRAAARAAAARAAAAAAANVFTGLRECFHRFTRELVAALHAPPDGDARAFMSSLFFLSLADLMLEAPHLTLVGVNNTECSKGDWQVLEDWAAAAPGARFRKRHWDACQYEHLRTCNT